MDGFTTNMKISNNIEIKQIGSDFKFEYYENCSENDTSLGSAFPLLDKCNINEINIENKNCTSLWNNNTKRKIIVKSSDEDNIIIDNLIINNNNNLKLLDNTNLRLDNNINLRLLDNTNNNN